MKSFFPGMNSRRVSILGGVIGLAMMAVVAAVRRSSVYTDYSEALSKMKRLQEVTAQMTRENAARGNLVAWTFSNKSPLNFAQWTNALVEGGHVSAEELKDLMTVQGETNSVAVYAVSESDAPDTVIFATRNWNPPDGSLLAGKLTGPPYGPVGFVIVRKDGSGAHLRREHGLDPFWLGSGGNLHFRRLEGQ